MLLNTSLYIILSYSLGSALEEVLKCSMVKYILKRPHKVVYGRTITINLISYRCSPWCNHMDNFVSYHFMAQSAPHWWGMFFTQQTSCLPYIFLIHSLWYIGIYTVDTLLYSLRFTNCIIPFLPQLLSHPQALTWVLQPELLLKVITRT